MLYALGSVYVHEYIWVHMGSWMCMRPWRPKTDTGYLFLLALHNFSILFYFILRQAAPFTDPEAREFG